LAWYEAVAGPGGRGLPFANQRSQHLANPWLSQLDQSARRLPVGGLVRYMDDVLVFGSSKAEVGRWLDALEGTVRGTLGQEPKASARRLGPVAGGVPLLGFRVWRQRLRLDGARRRRFLKAMRGLDRQSLVDPAGAARRASSLLGWARQAQTLGLRQSLVRGATAG
jgi:hypothetical protein